MVAVSLPLKFPQLLSLVIALNIFDILARTILRTLIAVIKNQENISSGEPDLKTQFEVLSDSPIKVRGLRYCA